MLIHYSRDWGFCLNDEPSAPEFDFPVLPPGVMYDVHHQCRLQYGPDAQFCYGIDVGTFRSLVQYRASVYKLIQILTFSHDIAKS